MLAWRLLPLRDPEPRVDLAGPTVRRRLLAAGLDLVIVSVSLSGSTRSCCSSNCRGVDVDTLGPWFLLVGYAVGGLLLLVVPVVRGDRATPGQATVMLALSNGSAHEPAERSRVVVRFAVRWLPILVWGTPAIAAVAVIEITMVAIRSSRTSLAGLIAKTTTVTHDRLSVDRPEGTLPAAATATSGDLA